MAAVKVPELDLTESEARAVATAYAHVAEFYPWMQQTAKAAAWTELLSVLSVTYGLRLVAIRNNRMKKDQPDNVRPLRPGV